VPAKNVIEKYSFASGLSAKEKSTWTERRLQKLQADLFAVFGDCKSKCHDLNDEGEHKYHCKNRPCDSIVKEMEKFLEGYGISLFKRIFKKRATCEEMDRVVKESISALLMDIWHSKKEIHTSFGVMLKWKMVYYLDGNINLFDNDRYCSMDAILGKFPDSNSDDNANDLITFMNETVGNAFRFNSDNAKDLIKRETIETVIDLAKSSFDNFNKFMDSRKKSAIYIRMVYALNRFLKKKNIDLLFKGQGQSKFYYVKLLDIIQKYLFEIVKV